MRPLPEHWSRVVIEDVTPEIDGGRYPAKSILGDSVVVEASVFCDGHDRAGAELWYKRRDEATWRTSPMLAHAGDRYRGEFTPDDVGPYVFTVCAWVDAYATFRHDLRRRLSAGQDVSLELIIGAELIEACAGPGGLPEGLAHAAAALRKTASDVHSRVTVALDEAVFEAVRASGHRPRAKLYERELSVIVDPALARFSAWYELFPRSFSPVPGRHGALTDLSSLLPTIAAMGFDVLYLPPIHPIGVTHRKGKNNHPTAEPDDVGSPWAIGSTLGGHKSVHPELGTVDDLRWLVTAAHEHGMLVALDVALQVSPDHPYVREHPEWFRKRPDGTIQYAENPPKKYEDIYPFDFECEDWQNLWRELASIFEFWIEQGVRIFRVDNPHTKPFRFWEWCIAELKERHPEVLFLSEAFTRPAVMHHLAKLGFSMSYTYFPWRNSKAEIIAYFSELNRAPVAHFFRGSHWPNTPDILPEHLQYGGRPAFAIRFVLAATLAPCYGIYGPAFELCEARALREGSEEYLDSEKYQMRAWDLNRDDDLRPLIARLNRVRRDNEALHGNWGLCFHETDNEQIIAYSKRSKRGDNVVLCIVSLDPYHGQSGWVRLSMAELGLGADERFQAEDLVSGARYVWYGSRNYVALHPHAVPAHVFRVRRFCRTESDFEYFL